MQNRHRYFPRGDDYDEYCVSRILMTTTDVSSPGCAFSHSVSHDVSRFYLWNDHRCHHAHDHRNHQSGDADDDDASSFSSSFASPPFCDDDDGGGVGYSNWRNYDYDYDYDFSLGDDGDDDVFYADHHAVHLRHLYRHPSFSCVAGPHRRSHRRRRRRRRRRCHC
jgi:hypothetical protein